ncbi:MAG: O-acetyl-ADP-ribose deacetylase [Deltaproteobacteria bacterium]|nr:O-acetyl-ADP-ribose deacetylase [Deltaproteobacteria bacterium]
MEKRLADGSIELIQADITGLQVDAIVTAANSGLRGGGGVDGAVHRAAGPRLLEACRSIGGCQTGSAVATDAFNLGQNGVKYVLHAVGPVWRGGTQSEPNLLRNAYATSLKIAREKKCSSIAFPSISTGVYGFPIDKAAPLALLTCKEFLESEPGDLLRIVFALFDQATLETFESALNNL